MIGGRRIAVTAKARCCAIKTASVRVSATSCFQDITTVPDTLRLKGLSAIKRVREDNFMNTTR